MNAIAKPADMVEAASETSPVLIEPSRHTIADLVSHRTTLIEAARLLEEPTPAFEQAWQAIDKLTVRIFHQPAGSWTDLVEKIRFFDAYDEVDQNFHVWKPCTKFIDDVQRMAAKGGQRLPAVLHDKAEADFCRWLELVNVINARALPAGITEAMADDMGREASALFRSVLATPTATLGGIAGKLTMLKRLIEGGAELSDASPFEVLIDDVGRLEGVVSVPPVDDPAVPLAAEVSAAAAAIDALGNKTDELDEAYIGGTKRLIGTPAASIEGAAAKLRLVEVEDGTFQGDLVASALSDLDRLTGKAVPA